MPYNTSRFFRRLRRGLTPAPGLLWALFWMLAAAAPALADQTNPAGNVIRGKNPGMTVTDDNERLTNLGGIVVDSSGQTAAGMGTGPGSPSQGVILHNAGSITAAGVGADAADGLYVNGFHATQTNSGTITANSTSGTAHGMQAEHDYDTTQSNSGTITASSGDINHGMQATGANATLVNSGAITASSDRATAYGMSGGTNATLVNRGTITASSNGTGATGMQLSSGTGPITASSGSATPEERLCRWNFTATADLCGSRTGLWNCAISTSPTAPHPLS